MEQKLLEQIILGAPNFIGFALAVFVLYRRLAASDKMNQLLIDKWSECEDDEEKAKLAINKATNQD